MEYKFSINDFEGPLDLLLHLVKTSKMNIQEDDRLELYTFDEEKEEISDDEFSIESEEDLKRKIIEYEKYKKLSESLVELENKRNNFYTKSPMNLNAFLEKGNINFGDVHLEDLVDALKKLKEREKYNKPLNTKVTKKEYSIERRIEDIRKILQVRDKVEFLELFSEPNRDFLIVTFLSILTMSKNDEITLTQEDNFKPILIERSNIHE